MATHTVKDEHDLQPDCSFYVRSLSDPTLLIHGQTGDNYRRADGKEWPIEGLRVHTDTTTDVRTLQHAHAILG